MKKPILILLILLGLQSMIAQGKYDKLWDEVEKYELEGKFKSAAEVVDKILKKAERSDEGAQLVKSFICKFPCAKSAGRFAQHYAMITDRKV